METTGNVTPMRQPRKDQSDIRRYLVTAKLGRKAFDVELIATSEAAAISRTRGTLFHSQRDAGWYDSTRARFDVIDIWPLHNGIQCSAGCDGYSPTGYPCRCCCHVSMIDTKASLTSSTRKG